MGFFFQCIFVSFRCREAAWAPAWKLWSGLIIVSLLHQPVTIQTKSLFFFCFLWFSFHILKDHTFNCFSGRIKVKLLYESEPNRLEKLHSMEIHSWHQHGCCSSGGSWERTLIIRLAFSSIVLWIIKAELLLQWRPHLNLWGFLSSYGHSRNWHAHARYESLKIAVSWGIIIGIFTFARQRRWPCNCRAAVVSIRQARGSKQIDFCLAEMFLLRRSGLHPCWTDIQSSAALTLLTSGGQRVKLNLDIWSQSWEQNTGNEIFSIRSLRAGHQPLWNIYRPFPPQTQCATTEQGSIPQSYG